MVDKILNNYKSKVIQKPLRLLIITAVAFMIAELFIIYFMHMLLPPLTLFSEMFLNAFLLTALGVFILYLSLFRPMILHINERRQAEEKTKLAYFELNQVFQTAADGMRLIDKNHNIVDMNYTFASMAGIKKDEAIGKKCYEIFSGPCCHTPCCSLQRILGGEDRIEFEMLRERVDGTEIPCIVTAMPFYSPSDEVIGIVEDFKDITESKVREEALRVSEERAKAQFKGLPIPTYAWQQIDNDFVLTDYNYAAEEITCGKISDWLGSKVSEMYKDLPQIVEDMRQCFDKKTTIKTEMPYKFKSIDREVFFTIFYSYAPPDLVLVHTEDITERKRADEEIKSLKRQIEFVLGATRTGLDILDSELNIRYIDPEWQKVYGDPSGKKCYEYFFGRTVCCDDCCALKALNTKETIVIEKTIAREGNRPVQVTSIPFQDEKGEWLLAQIYIDMSERKKIEEEHLKIQKLESLGILAGGIAHDFNNILTAIIGNISLARLDLDPEGEACRILAMAEKASMRAKHLTKQLLTFSKGGEPIRKPVSIAELLVDSADLVLSGSAAKCEFFLPHDLLKVQADEGQISHVLANLLINANQAMPEGGIITVQAENVTVRAEDTVPLKEGKYVKISIKDQGNGIPQENLSKIFDPYFTTKQRGSGLGLATAYYIMEKHEGFIMAESELGRGSTFSIYLPAIEASLPEAREDNGIYTAGSGRVLVMDDEDILREFTCRMLSRIGYEVEAAGDGAEAIELYKRAKESGTPFDIVLMDLTIPGGMGGKEAIKTLLQIDPGVKAIVSSGYSNDPIMANYREYGFKYVVAKPYTLNELSRAVYDVIRGEV